MDVSFAWTVAYKSIKVSLCSVMQGGGGDAVDGADLQEQITEQTAHLEVKKTILFCEMVLWFDSVGGVSTQRGES